jgi:hypothetical protein
MGLKARYINSLELPNSLTLYRLIKQHQQTGVLLVEKFSKKEWKLLNMK